MHLDPMKLLGDFVLSTATKGGLRFTLHGEPVCAADLADPQCLLPLVVASIEQLHSQTQDDATALNALAPANANTHMLGWQISSMPPIPDGALLLYANHALRDHLRRPPQLSPLMLPDFYDVAADQVCELLPHIEALGWNKPPRITPTIATAALH